MKKVLLLLVAGLLAFGASISAMAGARLDSMGADVRQVDDQDVIWLYPNKAILYKDTVDFRLNGNDNGSSYFGTAEGDYNEWGGILKELPEVGVVGIYMNRPANYANSYLYSYQDYWGQYPVRDWVDSPMFGQAFTPTGGVSNWTNDLNTLGTGHSPENLVDIFWAKSIEGIDFGVVVNYGDYQVYEQNASDDTRTLGINVGAGFGAVGPFSQLNAHLGYQMGTADNPSNGVKDNGIYTIPFGVMGDLTIDSNDTLRVFVDGQWNKFSLKDTGGYWESDSSNHYLVGAAVNKKISGGKGVVSGGLFYAYGDWEYTNSTATYKDDYAYWDVIANVSVDAPVASWLNWRAGLTKMIFERWYQRNGGAAAYYGDDWTTNNNYGAGQSSFNTGFGVNVENWTLDANLSVGELEAFLGDPTLGSFLFTDNPSYVMFEVVTLDAKYKF